MIFGTRCKRKPKKYAKERELPNWKDVAVWKDARLSYVLEAVWAEYIEHVMFDHFVGRS
jgi:hypothetical protein